jgi:hypothetical protein
VVNENRPLADLDISKLKNVAKAFKGFRYSLSMAQATNAPITAGFQLNPCQALLLGDANGIDGMS